MINARFCIFMFVLLRFALPSLGDPSADATDLIEALKKTYHATEPTPELQGIITYCEKIANCKSKIIYLVSPICESPLSISYRDDPRKIILIQTHHAGKKHSDQLLTSIILHEIGHFENGDRDRIEGLTEWQWRRITAGTLSILISVGTYFLLNYKTEVGNAVKIPSSIAAHDVVAIGLGAINSYIDSKKEDAADNYAYNYLLADNNLASVLSIAHYFFASHDNHLKKGKGEFPRRFSHGYPSDLQRARTALRSIKNKDFHIASCIAQHPDQELKTELPGLIKKYCPEFMQKSP